MTERFTITGAGISDHEKKRLYDLKTVDGLISLCEVLNELHEENQELKKQNMEYYHLISCNNCQYQNYDWYDDGDEFEVCDKGNNEQQMSKRFCKDWKGR